MIQLSLAILALASAATGQPAGPPKADVGLVRIFISPAGEPFHSASEDYPSRAWFDAADANKDGKLTASEMRNQARTFFEKLDLDKNGKIDGVEIRNYEENIAPETRMGTASTNVSSAGAMSYDEYRATSLNDIGGRGAPPPPPLPKKKLQDIPRGAGRFSFFNFPEPVMRADSDLSGSVTLDEFDDLQRTQFSALDQKHRGYLEFGDLPRTPSQDTRLRIKVR